MRPFTKPTVLSTVRRLVQETQTWASTSLLWSFTSTCVLCSWIVGNVVKIFFPQWAFFWNVQNAFWLNLTRMHWVLLSNYLLQRSFTGNCYFHSLWFFDNTLASKGYQLSNVPCPVFLSVSPLSNHFPVSHERGGLWGKFDQSQLRISSPCESHLPNHS